MPNPLHTRHYYVFRDQLLKARLAAGVTQAQLAKQLRKPQSYVSKYERGERRLDFTEFMTIAELLHIDIQRFISNYNSNIEKNGRTNFPHTKPVDD